MGDVRLKDLLLGDPRTDQVVLEVGDDVVDPGLVEGVEQPLHRPAHHGVAL